MIIALVILFDCLISSDSGDCNDEATIAGESYDSRQLPSEYEDEYGNILDANVGNGFALFDLDKNGVDELLIYKEFDYYYRVNSGPAEPGSLLEYIRL